jgi:RHS repeat-associated protein
VEQRELIHKVQSERHLAYSETHFTAELPDDPDQHRLQAPCEVLTYELTGADSTHGFVPSAGLYFSLDDLKAFKLSETLPDQGAKPVVPLAYHEQPTGDDRERAHKCLVEWVRILYFKDDLSGPEQFGKYAWLGLPYETYKLALTEVLLTDVLMEKFDAEVRATLNKVSTSVWPLAQTGFLASGYQTDSKLFHTNAPAQQWWMRSGVAGFAGDAADHFYLPEKYTDPFGNPTTLEYDPLDLHVRSSSDALRNTVSITRFDYRVLVPCEIRDINGNLSEVAFDVLGLPTATAVKGKGTEGDSLEGVNVDPDLASRLAYFTENFDLDRARQLLGNATARYVYYFGETIGGSGTIDYGTRPPCVATIVREQHVAALESDPKVALQAAFEYSDGSGNVLVKKARAEPAIPSDDESQPARFVIDDFSTGSFHRTYLTTPPDDAIYPETQTGSMAGGDRYYELLLRGAPNTNASVDISPAGGFNFTSDAGVGHRFDWNYGTTYIRYTPMSLDLSGYNAIRFHFDEVPRGLNFNVLVYFRGQVDNYACAATNIWPHTTPFDVQFGFDEIAAHIADRTRSADFAKVSGIYLVTQSGGVFAGGGESFALRAITAVSVTRWVTSGKTILNNKGKPVKQYEPYFTDSHVFKEPIEKGVTPLMYYDAAGRLIRTDMPDGTFSRVEFFPWHVNTFDANDTAYDPDPVNPNHSDWYRRRTDPTHPLYATFNTLEDHRAAELIKAHANTTAQVHLDSLGREVIAIAHNRTNGIDDKYLTFTKLDAEGKPLWICDARGNLVMQYITPPKPNHTPLYDQPVPDWKPAYDMPSKAVPCYDIAGNLLFQHSMDADDRWMLIDAAGKPMLAWDMNETPQGTATTREDRVYRTDYDALHRPTAQWLKINNGPSVMLERYEYQDAVPHDIKNLNGQLVRHYDPGGLLETIRRDFKGNVEEVHRTLNNAPDKSVIDWQTNPANQLETETYVQITEFDALNRMTRLYNWHRDVTFNPDGTQRNTPGSTNRVAVYVPEYNERGALKGEWLHVRASKTTSKTTDGNGVVTFTPDAARSNQAIKRITYNAKGQKTYLKLGNGTLTQYDYDEKTFRLKQIRTTRPADASGFPQRHSNLQDAGIIQQLHYTYDPVGNITEIYDEAYKPAFFANVMVEPRSRYEYDALYRLISATGRENSIPTDAPGQFDRQEEVDFPVQDGNALRNYTQRYQYDNVGNIQQMRHTVTSATGGWTRDYAYAFEDHPRQPASNRLWQTWTGGDRTQAITYGYDTHGNMLNLARTDPRFDLQWDHRDMINGINLGGGGTAFYQYDSGKQRTRKRIVNQNNTGYWECVYLGGYERYRRYNGNGSTLVEEIESHHLFEGEQRVLLVDDVITTNRTHADGRAYKTGPIYRYQYSNHLGSACLELDHEAAIISYEEYHPYGTSAYRAMRRDSEAPAKRYRYTGMERDEESGLGYHGARFLQTTVGLWISIDPNGIDDGINLYTYCHNNPVTYMDSSGRSPLSMVLGAIETGSPFQYSAGETGRLGRRQKMPPLR